MRQEGFRRSGNLKEYRDSYPPNPRASEIPPSAKERYRGGMSPPASKSYRADLPTLDDLMDLPACWNCGSP